VTACTGDAGVRTSQWKGRGAVAEGRWLPDRSAVTDGAIEWEGRSLMVRSDDLVVVVQVAR
jgi:hypothetical protein